jgi:hypothetical protein
MSAPCARKPTWGRARAGPFTSSERTHASGCSASRRAYRHTGPLGLPGTGPYTLEVGNRRDSCATLTPAPSPIEEVLADVYPPTADGQPPPSSSHQRRPGRFRYQVPTPPGVAQNVRKSASGRVDLHPVLQHRALAAHPPFAVRWPSASTAEPWRLLARTRWRSRRDQPPLLREDDQIAFDPADAGDARRDRGQRPIAAPGLVVIPLVRPHLPDLPGIARRLVTTWAPPAGVSAPRCPTTSTSTRSDCSGRL